MQGWKNLGLLENVFRYLRFFTFSLDTKLRSIPCTILPVTYFSHTLKNQKSRLKYVPSINHEHKKNKKWTFEDFIKPNKPFKPIFQPWVTGKAKARQQQLSIFSKY